MQYRADLLLVGVAAGLRIQAADAYAAAVGRAQPFENLDGAGLPGAVGAQQAENFALLHLETHAAKGLHVAIALGQVVDFDDRHAHVKPLSITHSEAGARTCLESPSSNHFERALLPGGVLSLRTLLLRTLPAEGGATPESSCPRGTREACAFAFEQTLLQAGEGLADEDSAAGADDAVPGNAAALRTRTHGVAGCRAHRRGA